ncbi:hypothetical protein ACJ72_00975 [Emergomyces africanus]|uniref:Major facilitator superfamily (MFS) profile domain-containing protein n=1 Tax=Emergomyces africanus TaxID=1955775 RepID=A0A1B7P6I8_9EURO|nr:hypothetical protein ACJ72_00975 [Emergomyces africanus]
MEAGWFYSPEQIRKYLTSRASSLKPPETSFKNPISILCELNRRQWLMFLVGYLAWVSDGFDFYSVSLSATEIADDFGVSNREVSWGMTTPLMLRAVGAVISGICSDHYGRKWPIIINLVLFAVVEVGTGFCENMGQFTIARALFGLSIGGLLGSSVSAAVEDLPYDSRGLMAGLFQQGHALGHALAAALYRVFVPDNARGWRNMFWFGAVLPILVMLLRWYLPETHHFQATKAEREARATAACSDEEGGEGQKPTLRSFTNDAYSSFKKNWVLIAYMALFMTGFNFCSHGSQDLYPTFLKDQLGESPNSTTMTTVVGQMGSITGGTIMGYLSTLFGRRLTMLIGCLLGGAMIPSYSFPHPQSLAASSFIEQFFIGGAWGPTLIHLLELSPQAIRGLMVGLTYQLGNLASSGAVMIELALGDQLPPTSLPDGEGHDYGRPMAIFMAVTWTIMFIIIYLGPEMTQEEREKLAAALKELFLLIEGEGMNPAQAGEARARIEPEQGNKGRAPQDGDTTEQDDPAGPSSAGVAKQPSVGVDAVSPP